jgi:outer membrane protein, heavy metal efflux system
MTPSPYSVVHRLTLLAILALASPLSAQQSSLGGAPAARRSGSSPLTLRALLDAVRDDHPAIQSARARTRAAEGMRVTAGRIGNPMLSYQVENTTFPVARSVVGIDRETMAMATLPLDPFYLRGSRIAQRSAEVRGARADAERERQRVALEAAGVFYRVALARVTVATGADLVAWLDSLVAYNRARAREGVAAEADLLRSELERDRAAAEATMAEAELALASAQLASYLGAPQSFASLVVVAGETPLAMPAVSSPRIAARDTAAGWSADALSSTISLRPDIRAARERETAAAAGIGTERRMLLREAGATLGTKRMMGTNSMIAGVSLPFPLFDQNRGEIGRAIAERDIARADLAAQERIAYADVAGASEAARLLTDRAASLARPEPDGLLARADEMRRIALGSYREGAIPLMQVLDAARAWGETRLTHYRTLYAQHQAVLSLVVASGGDLYSAVLISDSGLPR